MVKKVSKLVKMLFRGCFSKFLLHRPSKFIAHCHSSLKDWLSAVFLEQQKSVDLIFMQKLILLTQWRFGMPDESHPFRECYNKCLTCLLKVRIKMITRKSTGNTTLLSKVSNFIQPSACDASLVLIKTLVKIGLRIWNVFECWIRNSPVSMKKSKRGEGSILIRKSQI